MHLRTTVPLAQERARELCARADLAIARARHTTHLSRQRQRESARLRALLREIAGLRRAMETRAVIEQAKGIVMARTGCDADRAFALLVQQSQYEGRKLNLVAAELVTSNVRDAAVSRVAGAAGPLPG